mgnify:CR=1 FL=1
MTRRYVLALDLCTSVKLRCRMKSVRLVFLTLALLPPALLGASTAPSRPAASANQDASDRTSLREMAERGNAAAAYAGAGAVVAIALCFAGGNIGDGPGWWVVVFSAALSTGVFYLLWLFFEGQASISDAITIDRDPAVALRIAGFFVGSGLILGRAVAGGAGGFPRQPATMEGGTPALQGSAAHASRN